MINMFTWIKNLFNKKNSNVKEKPETFKFHSGNCIYTIYEDIEGIFYINRPAKNNKTYKWYIPDNIIREFYLGSHKYINSKK